MTAIQSIQTIFPGSSPNVTCVAEFDDMVDVPLDVNITFGTGSSLIIQFIWRAMHDTQEHSLSKIFEKIKSILVFFTYNILNQQYCTFSYLKTAQCFMLL